MRAHPQRQRSRWLFRIDPLSAPIFVAHDKGFFAQEGFDLSLSMYQTGKAALVSTLQGKADFATIADTVLMFAALDNQPDEEAIVEMGEEILAELGYEVTCQTSSRQALALFRLDPSLFDLVITDQAMPDLTGMELAGEMLIIHPDLPIISTTEFSHVVNAEKAEANGIKGFVMKPLTKSEIGKTVRKALDDKKAA